MDLFKRLCFGFRICVFREDAFGDTIFLIAYFHVGLSTVVLL